jgi:hypothetical protein
MIRSRSIQRLSSYLWDTTLAMFLMYVRQVVVFYPAGDPKGLVCFLGNDTQYLYPTFQGALQMLSMWIMGWDFDRTNQPFAFDQWDTHQAEKPAAAQITSDTLDRFGAGPVTKHQHRPVQPGPNSFAPLYKDARVPGNAVSRTAPGGNEF